MLKRRGETQASSRSPSNTRYNGTTFLLSNTWRISKPVSKQRITLIFLLFLFVYISLPSRLSIENNNNTSLKREGRLVVALSTIPSRIHLLQPTLDSLLQQDLKPDLIYLTLPQKKAHTHKLLNYTLPRFITDYQSQGLIKVLTPQYDYGSIMKVLTVLQVEQPTTRIVYVDDDWIYDSGMLRVLYRKSLEYPNSALCLSGAVLRNYFRQITHTFSKHNHHPNLFMQQSGTNTIFVGNNSEVDHVVDLAQGFCGVLVEPSFFNISALIEFVQNSNLPMGVVKSDDFILSANLRKQNTTIRIVEGGIPPQLQKAGSIDKLSLYMYRHAMEAAYYLQQHFHIWSNYSFYNPALFTQDEWDAIDCEAGRGKQCDNFQNVLADLDKRYPP